MSYFSKKSVVVAQESSYGTNRVRFEVFVVVGGGIQYNPKKN